MSTDPGLLPNLGQHFKIMSRIVSQHRKEVLYFGYSVDPLTPLAQAAGHSGPPPDQRIMGSNPASMLSRLFEYCNTVCYS
jgi:hypothetical protein